MNSEWIAVVAAWIGAVVAGLISLLQWSRSVRREAEKELNLKRLECYPRVQEFLSRCYEVGWSEAMRETDQLAILITLSNQFVLWGFRCDFRAWAKLVDNGAPNQGG